MRVLVFILFFAGFFAQPVSAAPGDQDVRAWETTETSGMRFEPNDETDWFKIFSQADAVLEARFDGLVELPAGVLPAAGAGRRVVLRDIRILKGGPIEEASFRFRPEAMNSSWNSKDRLLVALHKSASGMDPWEITEMTVSNAAKRSLIDTAAERPVGS